MSEPEQVTSDSSIGAADTFSMQRCQEFIANRQKEFESAKEKLNKVMTDLRGAWVGAGSERLADTLSKDVKSVSDLSFGLERLSDLLKSAIERHGTATKTAEAIANAIELPTWEEEII